MVLIIWIRELNYKKDSYLKNYNMIDELSVGTYLIGIVKKLKLKLYHWL